MDMSRIERSTPQPVRSSGQRTEQRARGLPAIATLSTVVLALLVAGVAPWGAAVGRPARAALNLTRPRDLAGATGAFELVGHNSLLGRGMNAALAVSGRYAYVGSRTDGTHPHAGVLVIDIARPSTPRVVGEIGPPDEGNPGESSRELRVWPQRRLLLVLNFACNAALHACAGGGPAATVRCYDIAGVAAAAPRLVATYYPSRLPHEFFLWADPLRPGRALLYISTPYGTGADLLVADISGARAGHIVEIASWDAAIPDAMGYDWLHSLSLSPDGRTAYLAHLGGGFLVADTSDFAADRPQPQVRLITPVANRAHWGTPGAHSAVRLFGKPYALITDEVYGLYAGLPIGRGCPWGWARLLDIHDPTRPVVVSEYRVHPYDDPGYCASLPQDRNIDASYSSHNPTLTRRLAFVTWHAAGLQAIDIADPLHPTAAGSFVPAPLPAVATEDPALSSGSAKVVFWSYPVIQDGLIYVVDIRNGLYVLRYHGPYAAEVAHIHFLEGNSNLGDAQTLR